MLVRNNFLIIEEKKLKNLSCLFFLQDKLGAYFLSKMDNANKKTQEVCNTQTLGRHFFYL